jgi:hypothetical protein
MVFLKMNREGVSFSTIMPDWTGLMSISKNWAYIS